MKKLSLYLLSLLPFLSYAQRYGGDDFGLLDILFLPIGLILTYMFVRVVDFLVDGLNYIEKFFTNPKKVEKNYIFVANSLLEERVTPYDFFGYSKINPRDSNEPHNMIKYLFFRKNENEKECLKIIRERFNYYAQYLSSKKDELTYIELVPMETQHKVALAYYKYFNYENTFPQLYGAAKEEFLRLEKRCSQKTE